MSDLLPEPLPPLALVVPDEDPPELEAVDAKATLVLPTEIYAPWMRAIKSWLDEVGARNGEDYRAGVSLHGFKDGRHTWRVQWTAITPRGVAYLNAMAATLRMLPHETKRLEGPAQNG